MTERAQLALLASRVRTDERRLMAALERRGVGYEQVDTRTLHGDSEDRRWQLVLNREILGRGAYLELLGWGAHSIALLIVFGMVLALVHRDGATSS